MVMSALAWNLKSLVWIAYAQSATGSGVSQDGVRQFLHAIVLFPAQIVRSGRKIIYRIMGYTAG